MCVDDIASVVEALHMLCSGWSMGTGILERTAKETYWREVSNIVEGKLFIQTST
jgi:hypothetical protein